MGDKYPASYPGYLLQLGDGGPEDGRDDLSSSPSGARLAINA